MILIDVGSSTIKAYQLIGDKLNHVFSKSLHLKKDFNPEVGLNEDKEEELFQIIKNIIDQYIDEDFKVYGTAVFRQMTNSVREIFLEKFHTVTGLDLTVIDHEAENQYMLEALMNKCNLDEPVLILNIGGGSTEISIVDGDDLVESYNINIGVGSLLTKFPNINDSNSGISLEDIMNYVREFLPENNSFATVGFYTGGELTYMKLAGYELSENEFFKDSDHPLMISFNNFDLGNSIIFETLSIDDLKSLMPANPDWMLGARACSALAEAIFKQFQVKFIIPSDSNLINGIVRKDFLN